jgi:hypothetical protein
MALRPHRGAHSSVAVVSGRRRITSSGRHSWVASVITAAAAAALSHRQRLGIVRLVARQSPAPAPRRNCRPPPRSTAPRTFGAGGEQPPVRRGQHVAVGPARDHHLASPPPARTRSCGEIRRVGAADASGCARQALGLFAVHPQNLQPGDRAASPPGISGLPEVSSTTRLPGIDSASCAGKSTGTPGGWLPEITESPPGCEVARSRVKTRATLGRRPDRPGQHEAVLLARWRSSVNRQRQPRLARPEDRQEGHPAVADQPGQPDRRSARRVATSARLSPPRARMARLTFSPPPPGSSKRFAAAQLVAGDDLGRPRWPGPARG